MAVISVLAGLSNQARERSALICSGVGLWGMAFPHAGAEMPRLFVARSFSAFGRRVKSALGLRLRKDELHPRGYRCPRHLVQIIAAFRVGFDHRDVGALRFLKRLPSFAVVLVDFRPGRGDEDAPVVAKDLRGPSHVGWDRQTNQPEV